MSPGKRSYWQRKVPGGKVERMASRAKMEVGRTVRGTAPNLGVRVRMWITEGEAPSQECFQEGEGRSSALRTWGSTEGLEQSREVESPLSGDGRAIGDPAVTLLSFQLFAALSHDLPKGSRVLNLAKLLCGQGS